MSKNLSPDAVHAYVQYICLSDLDTNVGWAILVFELKFLSFLHAWPSENVFFFFSGRKEGKALNFCLPHFVWTEPCVLTLLRTMKLCTVNWLSGSLFRIIHHHGTASCIHGRFTSVKLRNKNKRPMIWRKGCHYLWSASNVLRVRWRSDQPGLLARPARVLVAEWHRAGGYNKDNTLSNSGLLKGIFHNRHSTSKHGARVWEVSLMVSTDNKMS